MADIQSTFELDSEDDGLTDHIADHIRRLLASGLHVSVFIEATRTEAQDGRSNREFQHLVQLFVSINAHGDGKVATRSKIEQALGVSPRTLARWEAGENIGRRGRTAKKFLQFVLEPEAGFTVTPEMQALAQSLTS